YRNATGNSNRLAPFGQMLLNDNPLFGSGFLTYFNPISKDWLYYSGFGLFYSIYIDIGFVGMVVLLLSILILIFRHGVDGQSVAIFVSFVSFSIFNFSFTDISVVFLLFVVLE